MELINIVYDSHLSTPTRQKFPKYFGVFASLNVHSLLYKRER